MRTFVSASILVLLGLFTRTMSQDFTHTLQRMAHEIVSRHFPWDSCVVTITDSSTALLTYTPERYQVMHITIPNGLDNIINQPGKYDFYTLLVRSLNEGCSAYIIHVKQPSFIIRTLKRIPRNATYSANRRYLYLPIIDDKSTLRPREHLSAKDIFFMEEMKAMPDLIVAEIRVSDVRNSLEINSTVPESFHRGSSQSSSESFKELEVRSGNTLGHYLSGNSQKFRYHIAILTHVFVGQNPERERLLDIWDPNQGFLYGADLYPDKISDLRGKLLTLATVNNVPYSVYDIPGVRIENAAEAGFIREFLRIHNATWDLVTDDHLWGDVWGNASGDGLTGLTVEGKVEFAFAGCFLIHYRYRILDFSAPYYHTEVTCVAPRPAPVPGWLTPFLPFSWRMWGAVGGALLGAVCGTYVVAKIAYGRAGSCTVDYVSLLILGLLVQQYPPGSAGQQVPLKQLVACLGAAFLLIAACYSCNLASILTVPRFQHPIDTIRDLAEQGLPWAGSHATWVSAVGNATEPDFQEALKNFVVLTEQEMAEHTETGDMAFLMERLPGGYLALGQHLTRGLPSSLRLMRQALYTVPVAVMLPKGSPYTPALNALVHRLVSAGVFQRLMGHATRTLMPSRVQDALRDRSLSQDSGPTTLAFIHIQGACMILLLGLLTAAVSFVLELLTVHQTQDCAQS